LIHPGVLSRVNEFCREHDVSKTPGVVDGHPVHARTAFFGKTEAEIDRIIVQRKVDSTLVVKSPITGRVTARTAAPGLFVQPGKLPAPYTVADLSKATAVPFAAVVWEGDGTMTVWVTTDRRRFVRRKVEIGLQRDGYDQILKGLNPGELIATEGAVFLSKMLAASSD
jgi:hypothetical protein